MSGPDPHPRVRLASPTADPGAELPFRILVIGDLAARPMPAALGTRTPIRIGADVDPVLRALAPRLSLRVADRLGGAGDLHLDLTWTRAEGMAPSDVIAAVPELARVDRHRQSLLQPGRASAQRAGDDVQAALLAGRLAAQVEAVLEQPQVRALDACWRALAWLGGRCSGDPGLEVHLLPATRDEVDGDLADAPEPSGSGLWRTLYADEYGQHGGRPWSLLLVLHAIGPGARDLALLRRLAALGAIAHTPVLADAAPAMLGLAEWSGLPAITDMASACDGPGRRAWQAWRTHDDARHAVLALPPAVWAATAGRPLAIPAAAVLAARLAECHARTRWCADAAGWGPAYEVRLPAAASWPSIGEAEAPLPALCLPTEEQARELATRGFAVLCPSRRRAAAAFPALPTLHVAADGQPTPLPLLLIADRIAHHLKVLSRERLGGQVDRHGLESELSDWLGRHVADATVDDPSLRARRPLRGASVRVEEIPGRAGWMRADLAIRPHLPGAGVDIELALASRIDRGAW